MKPAPLLMMLITFSVVNSSFSSEMTLPLEYKVSASNLVIVGTVTSAKLGEVRQEKHLSQKAQHLELKLKVDEIIYGKCDSEVTVNCYSVSYTEKSDTGGMTVHGSTAGFSAYGIIKGKKYIAYLKRRDGKYYLSGNSNQYLEKIDAHRNLVNDIGQTIDTVPLDKKLEELRQIVKDKTVKSKQGTKRQSTGNR